MTTASYTAKISVAAPRTGAARRKAFAVTLLDSDGDAKSAQTDIVTGDVLRFTLRPNTDGSQDILAPSFDTAISAELRQKMNY